MAISLVAESGLRASPHLRQRRLAYRLFGDQAVELHVGDRLLGQDVEAAHELARFLGVMPVFVQCGRSELELGLAQRTLQLAVGGLVEQGYDGIKCLPVRRLARTLDYGRLLVYFPSGWWIRKSEWGWEAMLAAFLALRRLKARTRVEPSF